MDADPSAIEKAKVLTGDVVDDLTDIVGDLLEVKWLLKSTSVNNAIWSFQFTYRNHWGALKRASIVFTSAMVVNI